MLSKERAINIFIAVLTPIALASVVWALRGISADAIDGGVITLDRTAAGWGWFVDATPGDSDEFDSQGVALSVTSAGGIDLLSVLVHELSHAAGSADVQASEHAEEVLTNLISAGTRRLPEASNSHLVEAGDGGDYALAVDSLFAGERLAAQAAADRSREKLFTELNWLE